jgi:hypothetical protein
MQHAVGAMVTTKALAAAFLQWQIVITRPPEPYRPSPYAIEACGWLFSYLANCNKLVNKAFKINAFAIERWIRFRSSIEFCSDADNATLSLEHFHVDLP